MPAPRNIREHAAGRALAITLACLLLFNLQWAALSHAPDECHDHTCIACSVPGAAAPAGADLDAPAATVRTLAPPKAGTICPAGGAYPSRLIRAPPEF